MKRDNKHPSAAIIRHRTRIAFPASKVPSGLYNCKYTLTDDLIYYLFITY